MARTEAQVVKEMIDALNQAYGGAWQMCHQRMDPRWLDIRNAVQGLKDGVVRVALHGLMFGGGHA